MKNRNVGLMIGAAAAIVLFIGEGQMFARTTRRAVAVSGLTQHQMPSQKSQKMRKSQLFKGTVAKSPKGTYELKVGRRTYRLQIAEQAAIARYVGKQVTVEGILNTSAGAIQVQQITLAQSSGR